MADEKGYTLRTHLEGLVRRGQAKPQDLADLAGPGECPDGLAYLLGWAEELDRSRRITTEGADPFGYPMIEAWARLTGRDPTLLEVDGLVRLDLAMRSPKAGGYDDDR